MKLAIVTLAAGLAGIAAAAPDAVDLRVMSFNVRFGTADDGPDSWEHRKDILVDTIRKASPDVIGTQECLDFQANYIVEKLPEYTWFGIGREADGSGEHMAVLYRKDLLQPLDSGHFWLSETPEVPGSMSWETSCTRMVTWLKFEHVPSSKTFTFYNTHLDHRSVPARLEGARLIAQRLSELDSTEPIILTGDFNCPAVVSEPWTCLRDAGMVDAWENCPERVGPPGTWRGFKKPVETPDNRIDWILTRGPLQPVNIEALMDNVDGRFPSDHLPVIATLRLSVPAATEAGAAQ